MVGGIQIFAIVLGRSFIFLSYAVLCTEQGLALEFFSFLCTGQETACSGRGVTFLAAFIRKECSLPKDTIHLFLQKKEMLSQCACKKDSRPEKRSREHRPHSIENLVASHSEIQASSASWF